MKLLTKVERALGDLVNEAPFLSVDEYGPDDVAVEPQGLNEETESLMRSALSLLLESGFTITDARYQDGRIKRLTVWSGASLARCTSDCTCRGVL